jgi:hypothetical protein
MISKIKYYFSNPINWFILLVAGVIEGVLFKYLPDVEMGFDFACWVFGFIVVTGALIASIYLSNKSYNA